MRKSKWQRLAGTAMRTAMRYAKIVWEVPAVKSVALTWLIRAGLSASGAAALTAIVDAVAR
ncbi:hypothetical protein GCM10020258_35470 [Sphingomonas yabuuchiae]